MKKNTKLPDSLRLELIETMLRIREFEEVTGEMFLRGLTAGSMLHLSVGEEAAVAGIGLAMQEGDYFTTHHRGHGIFIARGGKLDRMMAELFGRSGGYCRGKGGSMHIADIGVGHMGANAIVGANIPIALGGGFTSRYLDEGKVSVAFFGDGALNQGILYESMNMAALWDLPVMFAVINNQYGMGTRIDRASACLEFVKRSESFGVRGGEVDGMDAEEVWRVASELLGHSREGHGPTFLMANAYRYYGHGRKDPSPYRDKSEEEEWRRRDPIEILKRRLLDEQIMSEEAFRELTERVNGELEAAVEFARASPLPEDADLYRDIYVEPQGEETV
jgi:acetoin:2,6-dichlorophenolindophenol oxidoreductase subunit alpha